jgi:ACR3 family arsenite efflux pump ArsB
VYYAVVSVSLPVAFGLWFMMYPVLVKVRWEDFGNLFKLRDTYTQMGFSVLANWVCNRIFFTRSDSKLKLRRLPLYIVQFECLRS